MSPGEQFEREQLVLLHGFGATPDCWEPLLPLVTDRYDVHLINLPGHLGGKQMQAQLPVTIRAIADLLESELDQKGLSKAHIVGNSLGGYLAIELGARGRALSVTALAPAGGWRKRTWAELRLAPFFLRIAVMSRIGLPIRRWLMSTARRRRLALADMCEHAEMFSPQAAEKMLVGFVRCPVFFRLIWGELRAPMMESIGVTCPLTIAWGTKDRILPITTYADRWQSVYPEADWRTWYGVGHVPMADAPGLVMQAINETVARASADSRTFATRPQAA